MNNHKATREYLLRYAKGLQTALDTLDSNQQIRQALDLQSERAIYTAERMNAILQEVADIRFALASSLRSVTDLAEAFQILGGE